MTFKIHDLSQGWGIDTPLWPFPGPRTDLQFPRGEYLGRFHKRTCTYTGTLHAGTHMDAPIHVLHREEMEDIEKSGYYLAEIPLESCIGTGVILDMRGYEKWHIFTPGDFEKACAKDGLEIREGDWVVVNTGYHHFWRVNNYKYYNEYPGLGPEAANWLIDKKIKGITGTWGATDSPLWHYPLKETMPWLDKAYRKETGLDPDELYPDYEPCHRLFMRKGIVTVENAGGDVDNVTGKRMIVAAFPFKCEVADGGMVRLVAIEGTLA